MQIIVDTGKLLANIFLLKEKKMSNKFSHACVEKATKLN